MRLFSNRRRPVHHGPLPLERIPRARSAESLSGLHDQFPAPSETPLVWVKGARECSIFWGSRITVD